MKVKYEFHLVRDVRNVLGDLGVAFFIVEGIDNIGNSIIRGEVGLADTVFLFLGVVIVFVAVIESVVYLINVNMKDRSRKPKNALLVSEMLNWADWSGNSEFGMQEVWKKYMNNIQEYMSDPIIELNLINDPRGELSENQIQCILNIYRILYEDKSIEYQRFEEVFKQFRIYMEGYRKVQDHYMSITEIKVLNTILTLTSYYLLE